jgi:hypothetical protein
VLQSSAGLPSALLCVTTTATRPTSSVCDRIATEPGCDSGPMRHLVHEDCNKNIGQPDFREGWQPGTSSNPEGRGGTPWYRKRKKKSTDAEIKPLNMR